MRGMQQAIRQNVCCLRNATLTVLHALTKLCSDLLKRHASVHETAGGRGTKKRRRTSPGMSTTARASRACDACAENHLKCDDEKPCQRCRRRRIYCVVVPRPGAGDAEAVTSQATLPPRTEPDSSLTNQLPAIEINVEAVTGMIDHSSDGLGPVSMEMASGGDFQLQYRPDQVLADQPGTSTAAEKGTLEVTNPLPTSMFLPNYASGTLTPNGLVGFGVATDLDFSAIDLSFIDTYNTRVPFETENLIRYDANNDTSSGQDYQHEGNEGVWRPPGQGLQQSIWRFVPAPTDGAHAEHANLSLPNQSGIVNSPESFGHFNQRATKERLEPASRDKILAIVLGQMKAHMSPALSSFPSTELLDNLIQFFLAGPVLKASSWIHSASFVPRTARPELLLSMAAYGAVLTPDRSLRKLGFAIQEVVRNHLPHVFEEDNTTIHDLQLQQAFLMHLEIGLWSGNSRKIEISESFQQPLLTMLRRRGWFKRANYPVVTVLVEDEGPALDKKWREWVGRENAKRLIHHLFGYDAQSSIALQTSPLISFAELDLPLPEPQEFWLASSAREWKRLYLTVHGIKPSRMPSTNDCVANLDLLVSSKSVIDFNMSCSAVLHALWGMVWEYRKLSLLFCGQTRIWDSGLALISRWQELTKILDYFRMICGSECPLLLDLILMHLHMSLEEIQLFVGLEGAEQAARVHQSVKAWVQSKTSRQAVWYAGQVFRAAKALPLLHLRDFYAISLYHASLAFWAYGLALRMFGVDNDSRCTMESASNQAGDQVVWLDGEETSAAYRYISLGIGIPGLQSAGPSAQSARLNNPTTIMDIIIDTMRQGDREPLRPNSPLVENLITIMERLRDVTNTGGG